MRWQYANGDVVNQVNRSLKSRFVNSGFSARPAYQVCSRQIPPAQSSSTVGSSWCYPPLPARHNRPTGCGVPGDVFCDGTECLRSDLDDKFQEVEFVVGTTSAARPGQVAAARATSVETILELFRLLYLDACWLAWRVRPNDDNLSCNSILPTARWNCLRCSRSHLQINKIFAKIICNCTRSKDLCDVMVR